MIDVENPSLALGSGITFAVVIQRGRLAGSDGRLEWRFGAVGTWIDGAVADVGDSDVDEARAAAERLAEERG